MRKFQPLNDNVLLRSVEAETKSAGGIYLPDTARETPTEGIVEALPAGGVPGVAVGDHVVYKSFSGTEISLDGHKFRLVPSGDLLAKFVEVDEIPE